MTCGNQSIFVTYFASIRLEFLPASEWTAKPKEWFNMGSEHSRKTERGTSWSALRVEYWMPISKGIILTPWSIWIIAALTKSTEAADFRTC